MQNKRFSRTEKAIFMAYFKFCDYPCAKVIAKRAGISRPTFYRHHQAPHFIPSDYEGYLLKSFIKHQEKMFCRGAAFKIMILRMLVFIYENREIIKALFRARRMELIDEMMLQLKSSIMSEWSSTSNLEKVYLVYKKEILGVIEGWWKHDFTKRELNTVLEDILYLTKTAPRRLSGLAKSK